MNQGRVQGPRLLGRKSECEALDRILTDAISGTAGCQPVWDTSSGLQD